MASPGNGSAAGYLAHLREKKPLENPEIRAVFEALLPGAAQGAGSAVIGKVGLALSGGGFRASFYHLGVLARLAELDVLRHLDVLSCVSGGSIVGACYWLMLRNCLLVRAPMKQMIDRHWDGIAAYCKPENKIALGFVEGLNNKIRVIQRCAYGLRDEEYLRLKILTCMLPAL